MTKCKNLGTTVLDELRLCYTAEPMLLDDLRTIKIADRLDFADFYLFRVTGKHFNYVFNIYETEGEKGRKHLGTLRFDRFGEDTTNNYIWLHIENWVLYDHNTTCYVLAIPELLGLKFNNFTALDLAKDFDKNIVNTIRRLYKDKTNTTIINGKAIKDRKKSIPELHITYEVALDRLKAPTFYVRQKEAKNKSKGICVCAYNKLEEITNSSSKEYITEFYNNPNKLHRLEVHINSEKIKAYFDAKKMAQNLDILIDSKFLDEMYYYFLSSVIRFTKGRNKLKWEDILCDGSPR